MVPSPRHRGAHPSRTGPRRGLRLAGVLSAAVGLVLAVASPALAESVDLSDGHNINQVNGGEVPVNICHATSSDTNPYVFITVDANSVKFEGHLAHAYDPNKRWKSDGYFNNTFHKKNAPKADIIGIFTYTDSKGVHTVDSITYQKGGKTGTVTLQPVTRETCAGLNISTKADKTATVGTKIADTAVISPAGVVAGSVRFSVYAPEDSTCMTPIWTSDKVRVNSAGVADLKSGDAKGNTGYTATEVGTYRWVAEFTAEDDSDVVVRGSCDDPNEQSEVVKAQPSIDTTATSVATLSGDGTASISDTATVSGGFQPTGKVSFAYYGPGDSRCETATPAGEGTLVNGVAALAEPVEVTAPGVYHWIATYEGDENNNSAAGKCGDEGETTTVHAIDSPAVNFSIDKVGPGEADPGAVVTYRVTVKNTGQVSADGRTLTVDDTLPPGATFVGMDTSEAAQPDAWTSMVHGDGTVTFTSTDALGVGASSTFSYVVDTSQTIGDTLLRNIACVSYRSVEFDCAPADVTVAWDLGITKTPKHQTARKGDSVSWKVTVTNHGPQSAYDPVITEMPGEGLENLTVTPPSADWRQLEDGSWKYNGLLPKDSAQIFKVTGTLAQLSPGAVVTNEACVQADQRVGADQYPNCDQADVTVVTSPVPPPPPVTPPVNPPTEVVNPSILGFTKDVNKSEAKVGQTLHYSMTATVKEGSNNGVARQDNVKIVDPLPQGITYVTDSGACTTMTKVDPPRKVTCTVTYNKGTRTVTAKADDYLQVGDSLELDFNATVDKDATKIHNVATASSDDVAGQQASADTSVTAVEGVIIEKPPVQQQPGTVAPGTEAPGTVAQPATLPHTGADGSRLPLAGLVLIGLGLAMVVGSRRRTAEQG